ncbi:MAG: hypothetical protein AAB352_03100 [Patescibacteria group bacterium]
MNKKFASLVMLLGLFSLISLVSAQVQIPNPLGGVNNFGQLLLKIADGVGVLIASLGTIMIIWAGILYLTSAGSTERMTKAKTALFYAIIGIAIGISARIIVIIIGSIIGVNLNLP